MSSSDKSASSDLVGIQLIVPEDLMIRHIDESKIYEKFYRNKNYISPLERIKQYEKRWSEK